MESPFYTEKAVNELGNSDVHSYILHDIFAGWLILEDIDGAEGGI